MVGWSDLTFEPNQDAIERLAEAWAWLLKEPFRPVLFSTMGDVFSSPDSGGIWWLNTGTGELTRVADSVDEFRELLRADIADEWLMARAGRATARGGQDSRTRRLLHLRDPAGVRGRQVRSRQSESGSRRRTLLADWPHSPRDCRAARGRQGETADHAVDRSVHHHAELKLEVRPTHPPGMSPLGRMRMSVTAAS